MLATPDWQISLTDPDARSMATSNGAARKFCPRCLSWDLARSPARVQMVNRFWLRFACSRRAGPRNAEHTPRQQAAAIGWSSAMGGSVAYVAIIGERTNIAGVAAIVLAISTALDLVVGYSGRARKHDNLYRRYSNLAAEIAKTGSPTGEQVRLWRGERLLIEKDEPTVKGVLSVRCHNEEAEARNYGEEHQYRVRWYQYLFAQLISLPPNKFARKPGRRS